MRSVKGSEIYKDVTLNDKLRHELLNPLERMAAPFVASETNDVSSAARLLILMLFDGLAIVLAIMGAVSITSNRPLLPQSWPEFAFGLLVIAATLIVFLSKGLYRALIRHMGQHAVWDLIQAVSVSAMVFALLLSVSSIALPYTERDIQGCNFERQAST